MLFEKKGYAVSTLPTYYFKDKLQTYGQMQMPPLRSQQHLGPDTVFACQAIQ